MLEYKQLTVDLGERSYPIWIGRGIFRAAGLFLERLGIGKDRKLLLISDSQRRPTLCIRHGAIDSRRLSPFISIPSLPGNLQIFSGV